MSNELKNLPLSKVQNAAKHPPASPIQKLYNLKKPVLNVSDDKVTYTHCYGDEIVSIHFDLKCRGLYYKGHNLQNLELTETMRHHLDDFKSAIEGSKNAKHLLPFLEEVLILFLKSKK